MSADDERVNVGVILTARVNSEGSGGYDLTNENGKVKIAKFGANNRTPEVEIADLAKAVKALEKDA